jgi:hypothetical protein
MHSHTGGIGNSKHRQRGPGGAAASKKYYPLDAQMPDRLESEGG